MVAWKNGRQLWSVNTSSASSCNFNNSTDKGMRPISISEGADGELWLILRSIVEPWACQNRLVSLNADTGVMLYDIGIGSGPAPGSGLGGATPTAWTYDDAIIVVDPYGKVREFDYTGLETTTAAYQLPIPSGHKIRYLASNNDGTVFAITQATWSAGQQQTLLAHTRSGTNDSIVDTAAVGVTEIVGLVPTSDGNVVAMGDYGKRLDYFNLAGTGSVTEVIPSPSLTGYPLNILASYMEDTNGNRVYMWVNIDNSTGNRATSVDVYDALSTTTSRVYERVIKPSDPTNYPDFTIMNGIGTDSVANGVLYFAICETGYATCASTSTTPDMTLEAIGLEDFENPIGKGFKRNSYKSDKLEYVAMGDSFSSGEGNNPFLSGTDLTGVDECHRSKDAYPLLLEEDSNLNLNLTGFVACSGAVISNITETGQWNEPKQLNALIGSNSDIVTLSVGGNDAGFQTFASACVIGPCDEYTAIYNTTIANISSLDTELEYAYRAILSAMPEDGGLYIIDYPMIVPMDKAETDLVNVICPEMYAGSVIGGTIENPLYNHWGNARAAQSVIASLNAQIELAVYNVRLTESRIHFVDISSDFEGHDICSPVSSFFINQPPPGTFHPDDSAHEVFTTALSDVISQ